MQRRRLLQILPLALAGGCLPKHAVARHDEVMPRRTRVILTVEVRTAGDVPTLPSSAATSSSGGVGTRAWSLTLLHRWARDFRDGSHGMLVVVEDAREEAAGEPVQGGSPLVGAWLEVRRFSDGRVLKVDGLGPWTGTLGSLESLDVLWPFLSPRMPRLRGAATADDIVSFPSAPPGAADLRTRANLRWRRQGVRELLAEGTLSGISGASNGPVACSGSLRAVFDDAEDAGRMGTPVRGTLDREVTTRWGARTLVQHQRWEVVVTDLGDAPDAVAAMDVAHPPGEGSMEADLRPLVRADGAAVDRAPVTMDVLPFLLLPPGLHSDDLAALRAALLSEPR